MTKKEQAAIDRRIDVAYRNKCCGIAIDLMDIPKIFKVGRELIAAGADDAALAEGIHTFVKSISKAT